MAQRISGSNFLLAISNGYGALYSVGGGALFAFSFLFFTIDFQSKGSHHLPFGGIR